MEQTSQDIVRGKPEKKLPQVVAVVSQGFGGSTLCSGTYIAPRVVLTAAHCLREFDAIPGQTFVYHGKNYIADSASLPNIPAPGKRSSWARAETTTAHPSFDASVAYPDLAVLHLDRELPFKPLPILRKRLSHWDKKGEIVGWGGKRALTPDISEVKGAGVKRSGKVRIVGSPTAADFHPDDPNPGILDPAIRPHLVKTVGDAPYANGCGGDSGGPLLVEHHGRDYLVGVGFWTGLSCEDYSMFTRIEPFLDWVDAEVKFAGKKRIVPRLECVEDQPDGSLRAYFGYDNQNKVTVDVRYGLLRNYFPRDTEKNRPASFSPGDSVFDFSVDFAANKELLWRLSPPSGPTTIVRANQSSPRCDSNDLTFLCAKQCDASLAAECSDGGASRTQCVSDCMVNAQLFDAFGCGAEWNAALTCFGNVPPPAENWDCSIPGFPAFPVSPNCDIELAGALVCLGF